MADYKELGDSFAALAGIHNTQSGQLGYFVAGKWRVVDPDNSKNLLVRFVNGTHISAKNTVGVVAKYDMWVVVGEDHLGRPVILGEDASQNQNYNGGGSSSPNIPYHTHVRGSPMQYMIDTWLLKQLRTTVITGTTSITVNAGSYLYNSALHWFAGSTLALSGYIPTSGYMVWVIVALNPATNTLVALPGTPYIGTDPADPSLIPSIVIEGYIPLSAVYIKSDDTELNDWRIEDLRYAASEVVWFLEDLQNVSGDSDYSGYVLTFDGSNWVGQPSSEAVARTTQAVLIKSGTLAITSSLPQVENNLGAAKTITKVTLRVTSAPAGSAIIVDIHKSGTTIFTNQAHRPQIAAGAVNGQTTDIDVPGWADGEYIEMQIDAVGSGTPGTNLTAHVVLS